ncbi:MAG: hypothetical protein AB1758_20770 [Candidatus Eremiobacterota bacterium]
MRLSAGFGLGRARGTMGEPPALPTTGIDSGGDTRVAASKRCTEADKTQKRVEGFQAELKQAEAEGNHRRAAELRRLLTLNRQQLFYDELSCELRDG